MTMHDYRQAIAASGIVTGLAMAAVNYLQKDYAFATVLLVLTCFLMGLLGWLAQGKTGSHISHESAQADAGEAGVIVYWRPGCIYCDRLKMSLGATRADVSWVNVLQDPQAADFVTGLNGGLEIVPTVVTGAGQMINPTPAAIKEQLRSTAEMVK